MTVIRIDSQNFDKWRKQIEVLLDLSVKLNFPDIKTEADYGKNKCEDIADYLEKDAAVIFAVIEKDTLAGWIWCHEIKRISRKRLHISEIAVDDKYRNQGIGRRLLETIEGYASEYGYTEIDLLVTASNDAAVRFYEKSSYVIERYIMKKSV